MKKIIPICTLLIALTFISLFAETPFIEPWKYNIKIELVDSSLLVNIDLKISNAEVGNTKFLLFNRYIQIKEASLNGLPIKCERSNDTMYIESAQKQDMHLIMKYEIPFSLAESSQIKAAYSDSIYTYPIKFDTSQIFFERSYKWYPVLYDNFSDYNVTISIPRNYKVFAYFAETRLETLKSKNVYSFNCNDEDFPLFITPDRFQIHKEIRHNNTKLDYYFLPRPRRLVAITDNKPVFISERTQIDSLLNVTINRSVTAIEWYNINLWKKDIKTINFVETGILGLGVGLGNFILMDRILMNRDAIDNYALSHEIAHLWLGIHTEYLAKGKFFMGESITEYVNLLFYESWAGNDAFEKAILDITSLKYSDTPFYTVKFEQVLNQRKGDSRADDIIYAKGVAFVHEFQKMIGRDKLFKIVRETYSVPNHFVTLKDFESRIKANNCWNEYLKLYAIAL
jgi:hypothetical protein